MSSNPIDPVNPIDPDDIDALTRLLQAAQARQAAKLSGAGAVAQGASTALGAAAVQVQGDNSGTVITGTQIVNHYLAAGGTRLSRDAIARQIAGYLAWLQERTACIELRGIERAGGASVIRLPLASTYVPLRARVLPQAGGRRQQRDDIEQQREADIALNQVLGLGHRLVVIGGPGSGKTTVLMHMAWALATALGSGQAEPALSRLGLGAGPGGAAALPLPILVPLASFARHRRHLPAGAPAQGGTLAHFISHHLVSKQADFNLPPDFFVQLLQDGRNVLLLLDGLDEVANEDERASVRQAVEDLVGGRSAIRVLVTCRPVAYRSGRTALGADFQEVLVQPLGFDEHITPMVQQAYACIYPGDSTQASARAADLLAGITRLEQSRRGRPSSTTQPLVDSPLMVRLLLIVHYTDRQLPDARAELFDRAVAALLQGDYGPDESNISELSAGWKLFRDMAQHLAFHLHSQGQDQGREVDEPALRAALRSEPEFKPHIDALLAQVRQRGSVLEERGGSYRFIHLAFQEFLVARHLREVVGSEGDAAILARLQTRLTDPWWREPILLLAGYKAAHAAAPARNFISALSSLGQTPDERFCAAELAGTAAVEWRDSAPALRADIARQIVALLSDATVRDATQPALRARAGDALARLGDPRFDATRLHLPADDKLGFVQIPADPTFCIGTRRADAARVARIIGAKALDADELNDATTPSPAFYIAKFAVTVAQFRTYLQATGQAPGDADALRDPDSRPVRRVNWRKASAYASWLNTQLASALQFDRHPVARLVREHGWRVALPSELEWEKAARGGRVHSVFPWGDARSAGQTNDSASGIDDTAAVGLFAANGFDLHDMVGNVWEWTRSPFSDHYTTGSLRAEVDGSKPDASVVVRGGSWSSLRVYARCACRLRGRPGDGHLDLGFRVVLRSAPVISPP